MSDLHIRVLAFFRDLLLPPRCLLCGEVVHGKPGLCPACWPRVTFISAPQCTTCGQAFEVMGFGATDCAACEAFPPDYDQARAAVEYNDASRKLLLAFKHGQRQDYAPLLSEWLRLAGGVQLSVADLIIPVPLHPRRLWKRRFNQSALLAQRLSRHPEVSAVYRWDLLQRRKATPSQGHLSPEARQKNVSAAFALTPEAVRQIRGKHIVLVDDVLTTGATANACARQLKSAGAAQVDLLTVARVSRGRTK